MLSWPQTFIFPGQVEAAGVLWKFLCGVLRLPAFQATLKWWGTQSVTKCSHHWSQSSPATLPFRCLWAPGGLPTTSTPEDWRGPPVLQEPRLSFLKGLEPQAHLISVLGSAGVKRPRKYQPTQGGSVCVRACQPGSRKEPVSFSRNQHQAEGWRG